MEIIKHTVTDSGITLFYKGKTYTVTKDTPPYNMVFQALEKNKLGKASPFDVIQATKYEGIVDWINSYVSVIGIKNPITYNDKKFMINDKKLPKPIEDKILSLAKQGESPVGLIKFCERYQKNPSQRSLDQLWSFLGRGDIPIDEEGYILAYKAVDTDLLDCHSRTIKNKIGKIIKMDRSKVVDDPNSHCHRGLHVGALDYVRSFGPRILIVRVDPMNVVSVPNDCYCMKMRVCEYQVIGFYTAPMANVVQNNSLANKAFVKQEKTDIDDEDIDDEDIDDEEFDEDDDSIPPALTPEEIASLSIKELFELSKEDLLQVAKYYDVFVTEETSASSIILVINQIRQSS